MSNFINEDGTIKWTKSDITRLRKAVNNFNAKRKRLIEKEENYKDENKIITNTIDKEYFKEIKDSIITREELREYIRSLRAFTKRGSEELDKKHYEETGQKLTIWQHKEIKRDISIIKPRLLKELEPYKEIVKGSRWSFKT